MTKTRAVEETSLCDTVILNLLFTHLQEFVYWRLIAPPNTQGLISGLYLQEKRN